MSRRKPAQRTPNAERTARTRGLVLEAAVDCLAEKGYAGTSTAEICTRTGLARGTVLHHFPNRDELIVAALDHVLEQRLVEFRAAVSKLPSAHRAGPKLAERALDLLWAEHQRPVYYAWLELLVASRTNPALKQPLARVMRRFDQGIRSASGELFPDMESADFAVLVMVLLNGLGLDRLWKSKREASQVLETLKALVAAAWGSNA